MPENFISRYVYKFTISSEQNTQIRLSFTPVSSGKVVSYSLSRSYTSTDQLPQAVDFSVGPAANASPPLVPSRAPVSLSPPGPPQYSTAASLTPHTSALPKVSTSSSDPKPSTSQAINNFLKAMLTQIQNDISAWSEMEPETDDEGEIPIIQNQLVRLLRSCPPQRHHSQTKGGGPK